MQVLEAVDLVRNNGPGEGVEYEQVPVVLCEQHTRALTGHPGDLDEVRFRAAARVAVYSHVPVLISNGHEGPPGVHTGR